MKLEFDTEADCAYFEISSRDVETTKTIEPGIMADYDKDGHLVGVEILSVSRRATPSPLSQALAMAPGPSSELPVALALPGTIGRITGADRHDKSIHEL